jgi:hypothetical protein
MHFMDGRGSTEERGRSLPAMLARPFSFGRLDLSDDAYGRCGWCAADNEQRFTHGADSIKDEHCTSYS